MRPLTILLGLCFATPSAFAADGAANFTTGSAAVKFGVHEIVLTGDGSVANAFDTVATMKFVPPSGEKYAKTVHAFYDGDNTWRARVYVSELGTWKWSSTCATDKALDGKTGSLQVRDSKLRGRLLPHPKNPRQWITEDGRWFLHLSDTAYFLLCTHDGNGDRVSDEDAMRYVRDDVARGITGVRCFLTNNKGSLKSASRWKTWFFQDDTHAKFRLDNLQDARAKPLPWLRGGRGSTELRDAEGVAHVILDHGRKAQEIALRRPHPM